MKLSVVLLIITPRVFLFAQRNNDSTSEDYEHYEKLVSTYDTKVQKCCNGFGLNLNQSIYQQCCGGTLYNNQTHRCCGKFIYEFNDMTGCCNEKIFYKNESNCCLSVLGDRDVVKIPLDIIEKADTTTYVMCCGLQVYDNSTHRCCPVRQFKYLPTYNDYSSIKKYYTQEEYDRRSEDTLNDYIRSAKEKYNTYLQNAFTYKIIAINENVIEECHKIHSHRKGGTFKSDVMKFYMPFQNDQQVIGVCNDKSFNIYTHICCSVAKVTGIDTFYESKLHDRKSKVIQCCGLEIYDFSTQICCNNIVYPQSDNILSACCGSQIYDTTQHICCDWSDSTMPITSLANTTDRCCGDSKTIYFPDKEICCGGTIMSNPHFTPTLNVSQECQITVANDTSCPTTNRNSTDNYICCDSRIIIAKESINDNDCCGDSTYNNRTDICCIQHDLVNPSMTEAQSHHGASSDKSCCGKDVYNSSHQSCCDGVIFYPNNELCCRVGKKKIVVQQKSNVDACCGTSSYDPETERCCNGNVIEALANHLQCCGSVLYDPEEDLCCKGNLYQPRSKRRAKCCGDKVIDSFKQICCRGVIKDVVNPLKSTCCYKTIP